MLLAESEEGWFTNAQNFSPSGVASDASRRSFMTFVTFVTAGYDRVFELPLAYPGETAIGAALVFWVLGLINLRGARTRT